MRWERERVFRCSPWQRWRLPSLLEDLFQQLISLPTGIVYVVIAALAALENVFPPVPADTVIAIGVFLSRFGPISAGEIFLITWVANIASAAAVYFAARTLGRRFVEGRVGQRLLRPRSLARIERIYDRYGVWGIFLSRFIPGVRAVVPPFAGLANLSAARALIPAGLASGIWYGAITLAVILVVDRLSDVANVLINVNRVAVIGVAVVVLLVAVFLVLQHRRGGTRSP